MTIHYLLVKYKNTYEVLSPETYGMATWGMNSQDGLEKKRKNWYTTYWRAGNEWVDDYSEEYKLNVVVETTNLSEVFRYLENHKCTNLTKVLEQIKEIIKDAADLEAWLKK